MIHIKGNFNRESFTKSHKFNLKLKTAQLRTNTIVVLSFGVILIVLNRIGDSGNFSIQGLPFIYGIICLIQLVNYNWKAAKIIRENADRFEKLNLNSEYIFDEHGFSYLDDENVYSDDFDPSFLSNVTPYRKGLFASALYNIKDIKEVVQL